MPHGYCTDCRATVTVRDGSCLLDHRVDPSTITDERGRHAVRRQRNRPRPRPHQARALEPATVVEPHPRDVHRPTLPTPAPQATLPPSPSVDADLSPTGSLLVEMWSRQDDPSPIEGWEPSPIEADRGGRRWGKTAVGLALLTTLAVGAWMASADGSEQDRLVAVTEASSSLLSALDDTRALASDMSDGSVADGLAGGVALSAVDTSARRLFEAASRLDPTGAATRLRLRAIDSARQALELEDIIGDALAYDSAFALILDRPPLPTDVAPAAVTDAALDVAGWAGRVTDATASLPAHTHLSDHTRGVLDLSSRIEDWQVSYLDALRSGQTEVAAQLVDEITRRLDRLDLELRRGLGRVGSDSLSVIDTLADDLTGITEG